MNQFMLISFANYLNCPKSLFKKKVIKKILKYHFLKKVIEKNYLNITF